jgi:hypothetical protein
MSRSSRGTANIGSEHDSAGNLKKVRAIVMKRVKLLMQMVTSFEKFSKDQFLTIVGRIYDKEDKRQLTENLVQQWFMMLLFLLDKSQLIQNGKIQFQYLTNLIDSDDEIHPQRNEDFSWGDGYTPSGRTPIHLTVASVQGYEFLGKEFHSVFKQVRSSCALRYCKFIDFLLDCIG